MKYSLANLSTLDLQLLLQARGEPTGGCREDLLSRVELVLDTRTPFTWHLRQLPSRGPPRVTCRSGGSLVFHKDRLYLYGGFDEHFHLHNDFLEGVLDGDQVVWSETNGGSLNGGPQLRDHYAFVHNNCIWLYGGVRIGLQRNTSEYVYYFDLDSMRWRSLATRPEGQNVWNRPDNQTLSGNTVAVFCHKSARLYAFGHQVHYELGNNGWKAAYLDIAQGLWHCLTMPEGSSDIQAACVWNDTVYVLDKGANLYVKVGTDSHIGWERVEIKHIDTHWVLDDCTMKLSGLVGSVWLLVSNGTPGPVKALQLNLADRTLQRARVDPLGSSREITVEFLSHTVVNSSMVVTGLLGTSFTGQSQSATFVLETVPGQVPEPLSGSVKVLQAISQLRDVPCESNDLITLSVKGKKFTAHKLLLTSRSKYFAKMFSSGMMESASNNIILEDVVPEVMDLILDFLYGRTISVPNNLAVPLFAASDRLDIPELTQVVVRELESEINTENVAAILQIAGRYDNDDLWRACTSFARASKSNLTSILRSADYLHLMEAASDLAQKFQLDVLVNQTD